MPGGPEKEPLMAGGWLPPGGTGMPPIGGFAGGAAAAGAVLAIRDKSFPLLIIPPEGGGTAAPGAGCAAAGGGTGAGGADGAMREKSFPFGGILKLDRINKRQHYMGRYHTVLLFVFVCCLLFAVVRCSLSSGKSRIEEKGENRSRNLPQSGQKDEKVT